MRASTSPVNIVATATVVTDEALLEEDELDDSAGERGLDVESVATDKSTNEDDEEVDVDVEETSSIDEGPISVVSSDKLLKRRRSSCDDSADEPVTTSRKKRRHVAPPMCNSEELRDVECHLETKELWDKFNDLGTEMIITKTGR